MTITRTMKGLVGLVAALSALMALIPAAMQGRVAEDDWQPMTTSPVSHTEGATVSRLLFGQSVDRIQRIDGTLTAVLYPTTCTNIDCTVRDVALMQDDHVKIVRAIPVSALDAERVLDNAGRVLWTAMTDNPARVHVLALNTQTAEAEILARDVFVGDITEAHVRAEGGRLYIEAVGDTEVAPGMYPVTIRRGGLNESLDQTTVMNVNWRKSQEVIEDISDDEKMVTRYTFDNGHQELWLHQRTVQRGTPSRPHSEAIAGSYTIGGHLVGAHFVDNDTIEFFRYQTLMRYTISTGTLEDLGERLHWREDVLEQEQLVITADGTLYFVAEDDRQRTVLAMRKDGETTYLGTASPEDLWIDNGFVTAVTSKTLQQPGGGHATSLLLNNYNADTGTLTLSFAGAADLDQLGAAHVWIDGAGRVQWSRTIDGTTTAHEIGSADRAWLLTETEVVTLGFDGRVYLTTVRPNAIVRSAPSETFYKLATSNTVYRVENGVRYVVPNEMTYFTWSNSFADVQTVSADTLNGLSNGGYLQIKPGTMIKTATSKHVMAVQDDWRRQRLASEDVAQRIYGDLWWQRIRVVEPDVMLQYAERQGPIDDTEEYYQNL